MKLDVAPLPLLVEHAERTACIVVDVLRASSSIVVLMARGVGEIVPAASPTEARRLARREQGRYLLCGEVGGLAPSGFDYGNSPSEFDALDLRGRKVVLSTTNGTRALREVRSSPVILVGALLNASAAARALLREAKARGLGATIVCAGLEGGKRLSLEDMFTAGSLVDAALVEACDLGVEPEPTDGSLAALRLYKAYGRSAAACFRQSEHGRELMRLGFGRDLAFCAQIDRHDVVPWLERGVLRLAV